MKPVEATLEGTQSWMQEVPVKQAVQGVQGRSRGLPGQGTNNKNEKLEKARMRGGVQGGSRRSRGVWGASRGVQGGSRGGLGGKTAKNTKKPEKRSGTVWLAYFAATSRILCRRFQ